MYEARRIPMVGQIFVFYGFTFEILDRRRNQITRVKLTPPASATGPEGEAAAATPEAAANPETTVSVKVQPKKPGGGTTGAAA
jgi:hypothetical protein